jgi:hypothetical protein
MPIGIPNTHCIIVRTLPATEHKPVKVTIKSELYRIFKSISRGDKQNGFEDAVVWLQQRGFDIIATAEGKGCNYIITSTFKQF